MANEVRDYEALRQVKSFDGLEFDGASPTDIDMFLELSDRLFVFVEAKHGTGAKPSGQRKALERLRSAVSASGRTAVLVFTRHDTPKGEQIYFADTWVEECWVDDEPYDATNRRLGELLQELVERFEPRRAKAKALRPADTVKAKEAETRKRSR